MASLIGPVATVPRFPRQRRESKWPLLLQIIGFRIRLRLTLIGFMIERKCVMAYRAVLRGIVKVCDRLSPPQ